MHRFVTAFDTCPPQAATAATESPANAREPGGRANAATTPTRQSLVIIGNGMVGHRLCAELVTAGAADHFDITVYGDEPRPAYDRIRLTRLLAGETADDLLLASRDWYADHAITLHTGERVALIDRDAGEIVTASDRRQRFDQLVLATGSRPFVPPIPGVDLPNVFVYRTIDDLEAIRERAGGSVSASADCGAGVSPAQPSAGSDALPPAETAASRTAVVIGGGLLGLEAAKALLDLGLKVHVVESANWLMPRQLDPAGGEVLREHVERLQITLHVGRQVRLIEASGDGLVLRSSGSGGEDAIEAHLVVVSAGIRPRDELARAAGLPCGAAGGVIVDDGLASADPRIHAIGECALHDGVVHGLAGPGFRMAGVLAARLCAMTPARSRDAKEDAATTPLKQFKRDATFDGADSSARLKLLGVDVAAIGAYAAEGASVSTAAHRGDGTYRKLILREQRLVGAVGVGPWPELTAIEAAIVRGQWLSERKLNRFRKTGAVSLAGPLSVLAWADDAVVCTCTQTTRGMLCAAISSGCNTLERLAGRTGASTVCGSCRPLLVELIAASDPSARNASPASRPRGAKTLLVASIVATLAVIALLVVAPLQVATSVQNSWFATESLWRESLPRQVTGFTALGLSVLALLLSIRKRVKRFMLGDFGWWRAGHAIFALLALATIGLHTGLRLGDNLNATLMTAFLVLNASGAIAGVVAATEARNPRSKVRRWRPWLVRAHLLLFLPLPVLVALHVLTVYLF